MNVAREEGGHAGPLRVEAKRVSMALAWHGMYLTWGTEPSGTLLLCFCHAPFNIYAFMQQESWCLLS